MFPTWNNKQFYIHGHEHFKVGSLSFQSVTSEVGFKPYVYYMILCFRVDVELPSLQSPHCLIPFLSVSLPGYKGSNPEKREIKHKKGKKIFPMINAAATHTNVPGRNPSNSSMCQKLQARFQTSKQRNFFFLYEPQNNNNRNSSDLLYLSSSPRVYQRQRRS